MGLSPSTLYCDCLEPNYSRSGLSCVYCKRVIHETSCKTIGTIAKQQSISKASSKISAINSSREIIMGTSSTPSSERSFSPPHTSNTSEAGFPLPSNYGATNQITPPLSSSNVNSPKYLSPLKPQERSNGTIPGRLSKRRTSVLNPLQSFVDGNNNLTKVKDTLHPRRSSLLDHLSWNFNTSRFEKRNSVTSNTSRGSSTQREDSKISQKLTLNLDKILPNVGASHIPIFVIPPLSPSASNPSGAVSRSLTEEKELKRKKKMKKRNAKIGF